MKRNVWNDFISLLYPNTCLVCHQSLAESEVHVCINCLISLSEKRPLSNSSGNNFMMDKFLSYPQVRFGASYLLFHGKSDVQKLIHAIKYNGNQELAKYLGRMMGKYFEPQLIKDEMHNSDNQHIMEFENRNSQYDYIIPVPLHKKREKKRGYNQSELLSVGFSEIVNIPILTNQIERTKETVSQTKKNKISRWESMRDIYNLTEDFCLQKKHVVIIDDVITTGATISGIVELLIQNDVGKIGIISLATEK